MFQSMANWREDYSDVRVYTENLCDGIQGKL